MIEQAFVWTIERLPEIIATITGLLYIIYSVEQKVIAWPYGIVSSAIYIYVFYEAGIYADIVVYIYYVVIGFFGWYLWKKGDSDKSKLKITKVSLKPGIILFFFTILFFVIIRFLLIHYTNSTVPNLDALTTALSFTATWMLTRKIIEHWIIWIIVDSISIGLYLYKELYPSIILFTIYTILAFVGYFNWLKEWKKPEVKI